MYHHSIVTPNPKPTPIGDLLVAKENDPDLRFGEWTGFSFQWTGFNDGGVHYDNDAEGQATVCFSNQDCNVCDGDDDDKSVGRRRLQPNPSWASVDGGSRRVRVTLALQGALAQPATVIARLSDSLPTAAPRS